MSAVGAPESVGVGSGNDHESDAGNGITNGGGGGGGNSSKCGQLSLTPRFTQEEKEILYSLFHLHEEVIDIKYRKKQKSKYSVRDAWETIVREFNTHQGVAAARNLKQIQKFWLNARLRKQYPFRNISHKLTINNAGQHHQQQNQQQQQMVNHAIKDEPDFQISGNESPEHHSQGDEYEEMEMEGAATLDDDPLEQQQQQQQQQLQQHQQQQHQQQQQQSQQQQHIHIQQATSNLQTQQINVDQISAEKLSLTDLLQFKSARPREDIILQIKHPTDATTAQITLPSPTRISLPQQQTHTMATITASGYNQQIISEIKPQQITLAQYQAQQQAQQQHQQQQQQQAQQQLVAAQQQAAQLAVAQQQQLVAQQQQLAAVQHQQQQQQQQQQHQHQVKLQLQSPTVTPHFATVSAAPTFTCTTFNTLANAVTPSAIVANNLNAASLAAAAAAAAPNNTSIGIGGPNNPTVTVESFEERINYFKLKEAELRYKEEQVVLEKKKIELNRAQEELKHMREIHRLHVEEVKMKIRILQEEEKQLRRNQSSTCS